MNSVVRASALILAGVGLVACGDLEPGKPTAVIDGPDHAQRGSEVQFDGSGSEDPAGEALEFRWRLSERPDDSEAVLDDSRDVSPSFLVDASGDYVVELVVSAGSRTSSPTTLTITVGECGAAAPEIAGVSVMPTDPAVGSPVVLSAMVEDADNETGCDAGQTFTHEWSLVALPPSSTAELARSNLQEARLVPDVAGEYAVELVVTDSTGLTSEPSTLVVSVGDSDVEISVSASPEEGLTPLTVDFKCEAIGDAPLRYAWSFGNGAVSTLQNPSFTYTEAGSFTATCLAWDVDGDERSANVDITVTQDSAPAVQVSADPRAGVAPLDVTFTSLATGGNGDLAYEWDFGDGKKPSSAASPSHTFASAGIYPVVLTVSDEDGDVGSALIEIAVGSDDMPAVAAVADPRSGVSPLEVQFEAFVGGGNAPLAYEWDFDDGESSVLPTPVHTFETTTDKAFTATVTVTDADGDTASDAFVVSVAQDVLVTAAKVMTTPTPPSGRVPLLVDFTCDGTGGNEPLEYAWTFGDGASSSEQNPAHVYGSPDLYRATCVVTDANGDVHPDSVNVIAQQNHLPSVTLSSDVTRGVEPLTVNFQATTSGGDAPLALNWNFGDGTTEAGGSPLEMRTYAAGTYQVLVEVEDADGDTRSATTVITVDP